MDKNKIPSVSKGGALVPIWTKTKSLLSPKGVHWCQYGQKRNSFCPQRGCTGANMDKNEIPPVPKGGALVPIWTKTKSLLSPKGVHWCQYGQKRNSFCPQKFSVQIPNTNISSKFVNFRHETRKQAQPHHHTTVLLILHKQHREVKMPNLYGVAYNNILDPLMTWARNFQLCRIKA